MSYSSDEADLVNSIVNIDAFLLNQQNNPSNIKESEYARIIQSGSADKKRKF
jgi:hypothetical protein